MKKPVSPTQKMLNTWAIVLIIWSFYRSYFKTDLPIWIDEFIAKPVIFLIPIYYYITRNEKLSFFKAVDFHTKGIVKDIVIGFSIGIALIATAFIVFIMRNTGAGLSSLGIIPLYVAVAFASSFSEEILSRGFVLKRLYDESKNVIQSVFFSSFLFFFLHIPIIFTNPDIRGMMLIQIMITDLFLSFAVSLVYLQRRSIIIPIIIHAFYNIGIYMLVMK
jgi:membrane protease YdiL (CAAX protease family)